MMGNRILGRGGEELAQRLWWVGEGGVSSLGKRRAEMCASTTAQAKTRASGWDGPHTAGFFLKPLPHIWRTKVPSKLNLRM